MRILASLLALPVEMLERGVQEAEAAGIDGFQVDVADGSFVPNISMGLPFLRSLRRLTSLPVDAHLMIRNIELAPIFAEQGADTVTVHFEPMPDKLLEVADEIRERGARPMLALNPGTPLERALPYLPHFDGILVMTVHPGFSGRAFLPEVMEKLRNASEFGLPLGAGVDGGVNDETIKIARRNGASFAVSSSFIFRGNIRERILRLRGAVDGL